MTRPQRSAHAVLLLLALLPVALHAYPMFWVDPQGNYISNRTPPGCLVHPDNERWGGHPGTSADATTAIALTAGGSTASTTVCPGQAYSISVSFGAARRFIVSSTYGTFASTVTQSSLYYYATTSGVPSCPNRVVSNPSMSLYKDTLTLPCGISGSMVIQVSSASSGSSYIMQTSATFTVDPTCGVGACAPPPAVTASPPPAVTASPPPAATTSPARATTSPPAVIASPPPAASSPSPATLLSPPATPPAAVASPPSASASPATATVQNVTGCAASSLNYTCSVGLGDVTIHYTLGGKIPSNLCTSTNGGTLPLGITSGSDLLHMAVQATTTGYVGVGFATQANVMAGTDLVVGWMNSSGQGYVGSFYATSENLSPNDASGWTVSEGVAQVGSTLVVCFTRTLTTTEAVVSQTLDPTQSWNINWAVSSSSGFVVHSSQGGGTLNLVTGATVQVKDKKQKNINIHGACMATAYALLLPLGALFPCHRWVLGNMKLFGVHVWFRVHVLIQMAGVILATVGFAWSFVYLDNPAITAGRYGDAHRTLGIIAYALTCVQALAGFLRPPLDSSIRFVFTHGHRWVGRVTIVSAWAVIYLGIWCYHIGIYQATLLKWIVPVAVSMAVMLLLDLGLTIAALIIGNRPGQETAHAPNKDNFENLLTVQLNTVESGQVKADLKSAASQHVHNSRELVP